MAAKKYGRLFALLVFLVLGLQNTLAAGNGGGILFLDIKNQGKETRYDYLASMIKAVLLFDFAAASELRIIDQLSVEKALLERKLLMNTLGTEDALQLAQTLGADYVVSGRYQVREQEAEITVSLLEVKSKQPVNFNEQGQSENLIHAIAEQIVFRLTGKMQEFQSELYERSLISLIDEKAGSIALHTTLKEAEVFLNNELVGYTSGILRTPLKIEGLKTGRYTLRVHLPEFGVVRLPEVTFHDWQQEIEITPGKNYVVRANIEHFSYLLTRLIELVSEKFELSLTAGKESYTHTHEITFQDRKGKEIKLKADITGTIETDKVSVKTKLIYNDKEQDLEYTFPLGGSQSESGQVELVKITISTDYKYKNRATVSYLIERTDITPNMWKE
jgi:TolB-like protein